MSSVLTSSPIGQYNLVEICFQPLEFGVCKFTLVHLIFGSKNVVLNLCCLIKRDSTAPFGEQARVTVATNYTANVAMCTEFLPLMANKSR